MPAFDVAALRRDFPILGRTVRGRPLAYLDNAATSQKPAAVIRALGRYYSEQNANVRRGVHLLLEPGRSIVGPAGALLVRVLYRKTNNGKSFVVVDCAMNDLLRPALYGAYHEIVPAEKGAGDRRPATGVFDVVGPICETGDFLARKTVNGRVGQPEEIAHAIYFLADGEQSSFIPALATMIARAGTNYNSKFAGGNVPECDLVVKGVVGGLQRGWVRQADGTFKVVSESPELIEPFMARWREGYDVVYAVREQRDALAQQRRLQGAIREQSVDPEQHQDAPVPARQSTGISKASARCACGNCSNTSAKRRRFSRLPNPN